MSEPTSSWVALTACVVDLAARVAHWPDHEQTLSRLEAELLAYLAARPGQPVSRDELLVEVWGFPKPVVTRAVDNTMGRLRVRVERDPKNPDHLTSLRGVGYCWVPLKKQAEHCRRGSFHGRHAELSRIDAAIDDGARLVLLHGTGGAGKTRLAAEWAAQRKLSLVHLGQVDDIAGVAGRIAQGAGVPLPPGQTSEACVSRLQHALSARPSTVLVLDELEGCVDAAHTVLSRLLADATRLQVVATSRQRLGLLEAVVVPVGPLEPAAARALLMDRAGGLAMLAADALEDDLLDSILDRLDRLPLAIELAAPGITTFGKDSVDLLHTAPGARSLASVIQQSWDRLAPAEQATLLRVAVFEDPVTMADLTELGASPAEVHALTEASLLHIQPPHGHLRLLETTRHWLQAALARHPQADPWRQQAARRRLHHAEELVDGLFGPAGARCRHQLRRRTPALRRLAHQLQLSAPALAARLLLVPGPALLLEGPAEMADLDDALSFAHLSGEPELVAHARCLRGALLHLSGQVQAAYDELSAALADSAPLPPALQAELQVRRGYSAAHLGQIDAGLEDCRAGAALAEQATLPRVEAMARVRLGALHHLQGDARKARRALRRALELHQSHGDTAGEARTLGNLALYDIERGHHARAAEALKMALDHAQAAQERLTELQLRINLGGVAHLDGRIADAQQLLGQAHALSEAVGDALSGAITECTLGVTHLETGALSRARRHLSRARLAFDRADHPVYRSVAWEWLALLEAEEDDPEAALEALESARAALPSAPGGLGAARQMVALGVQGWTHTEPVELSPHTDWRGRSSAARLAERVVQASLARRPLP